MAWNPTYKVNLVDVFDRAYSSQSKEFKSALRPVISTNDFKQAYGNRLVEKIVERTQSGIDKKGSTLGSYSTSYKESLVFKIYNKSNPVNLTLTGEMLASLEPVSSRYTITVQLADDLNKAKAHGHITGLSGSAKKRDFLGLPATVEAEIMRSTIKDFRNNDLSLIADLVA